jgi:hypothetical protein
MSANYREPWACVLLAFAVLPTLGCNRGSSPAGGPGITRAYDVAVPDPPEPGKVRLVAQKVREDATTVHWKWTVVGDRNWTGQAGSTYGVELKDGYPLNATDRVGGTNAFECELVVSTAPAPGGKTNLTYQYSLKSIGTRMSGAVTARVGGGGGVSGSGTLWVSVKPAPVNQAVTVLATGDQAPPLPLDTVLVTLKGESADGKPLEHRFRLKASE